MFEFNTSTLLENAFKALPSHFFLLFLFLFFAFYFFLGGRVLAPIPRPWYQNLAGYIAPSEILVWE